MGRLLFRIVFSCSVVWLVLGHCAGAWAVVVASNDDSINRKAPASNPAWNNMAQLASSSAVYLGNRWMITANHVSETPVRFTDGRVFDVSLDSAVRIFNTGQFAGAGNADLRMFRLVEDPGLPTLTIASSTPKAQTQVMMIGAGQDRSTQPKPYLVTGSEPNLQWEDAKFGQNNLLGYSVLPSHRMRWGFNKILPGDPILGGGNTLAYATRWDIYAGGFEAQVTNGDSGGGVFEQTNGNWELTGVLFASKALSNQPDGTVVLGDFSYAADLSFYRDQILSVMNGPERFWQNQTNRYDVNHSGRVSAQDVQLLINELTRSNAHSLDGKPGTGGFFYDVNGDGNVSAADVKQIIDALILGRANPEPVAAPQLTLVPEPSSIATAVGGLLTLACGGAGLWLKRRRAARKS